jgi:hypothetical protein
MSQRKGRAAVVGTALLIGIYGDLRHLKPASTGELFYFCGW